MQVFDMLQVMAMSEPNFVALVLKLTVHPIGLVIESFKPLSIVLVRVLFFILDAQHVYA